MPSFLVNKGVGKSIEVKGLRAQYVIYAVASVVISLCIFFVCSFLFSQLISLLVSIVSVFVLLGTTIILNNRYGEFGIIQLVASRAIPDRLSNSKRLLYVINKKYGN